MNEVPVLAPRAQRACERARSAASIAAHADGLARSRWVAMGDPQAPLEKVIAILERHGLLGDDGALLPEVGLVSMGDHFDWGGADLAARAAADGTALLAWLLSHPKDQVVVLAGNHDLGRVCELAAYDDETFPAVRSRAHAIYLAQDEEAEARLKAEHPALPTAELAARDFAGFERRQRDLVVEAVLARRMVAARAIRPDVLLLHAGVTRADLEPLGAPADALAIADALNDALVRAFEAREEGVAMRIPHLHEPGCAAHGEGGGIFYHRPTCAEGHAGPLRRRFDARMLPAGVTQVIGHVGDEKARELLSEWVSGEEAHGRLRSLVMDGSPAYRTGVFEGRTRVVFTDGGMNRRPATDYELLDLVALTALPTAG